MMKNDATISNYNVLLMDYAAGALDPAQSMIVAAHINLFPRAQALVRTCESIGGALIERHCEPVAMNHGSLDHVLRCLEQKTARDTHEDVRGESHGRTVFPDDLCAMPECVEKRVRCSPKKQLKWKRVYRGIHYFAIPLECRSSRASVFRFDPGIQAPRHAHRSLEITLVIDGGLEDETGHYSRGDLVISDPETPAHAPQACSKSGCTYMSVFSGGVRLAHPLEALLHPFKRF